MKEIGGYIEFETYRGQMLHSQGIKLNCGRNCLAYLIISRQIKKIALPYLMCNSIIDICVKYGVEIRFYHVNTTLIPEPIYLSDDEWFYLMSYYGQMTIEQIGFYVDQYKRVIVDFSHDYFHDPIPGVDCLYTCRKFFGVADGAILYTDSEILGLEYDETYDRMKYLLGRFERTAVEFYNESIQNNMSFNEAPLKKMSKLTENLLRGIDYDLIKKRRTDNYMYLNEHFKCINQLKLKPISGAFMYPLMIENGTKLRKYLNENKIYVPVLWPNVKREGLTESQMAINILPIPCDHRYDLTDMDVIITKVLQYFE